MTEKKPDEPTIAEAMKRIEALEKKVAALKAPDLSGHVTKDELDHLKASLKPEAAQPRSLEIGIFGVPEDATVGEAFEGGVVARGGSGAHSFHIEFGKLPDGLSMAAGGAITGTPTTEGEFAWQGFFDL